MVYFQRPNKVKMRLDTLGSALRLNSPLICRASASSPVQQRALGRASVSATRDVQRHRLQPFILRAAASTMEDPGPYPPAALSTPVYSLATVGADGQRATLNLVTYASPISLTPRHYALGLYVNTLSWENFLATGRGVLQILGEQHVSLFDLLGKQSGRDVDKVAELQQRGFKLTEHCGVPVLEDCCGWMELRRAETSPAPLRCGDHDVVLCQVAAFGGGSSTGQPLYTGLLRQQGLMK